MAPRGVAAHSKDCKTARRGELSPMGSSFLFIWVIPQIGVPKMDGENNGKPY